MPNALNHTFRALFEGVALADLWAAERRRAAAGAAGANQSALAEPTWQPVFLRVARDCAAGAPITGEVWARHFQAAAAIDLARLWLQAVPVLLVSASRYGHRRQAVHQWGQGLGLAPGQIEALDQLFQLLCQALADVPQPGAGCWGQATIVQAGLGAAGFSDLGTAMTLPQAQALVDVAQGQFSVGVGLANGLGWSSAAIGLVGLLTALRGGVAVIPASFRQRWLAGSGGGAPLSSPWPAVEQAELVAIADALYGRWAGIRAMPAARRLPLRVAVV
ncbi:MAG: hypothetical protein ACFCVD_25590 [Nodosilinea sp.]